MKFVFLVPLLVAGCAMSGSWLDNVGKPPRPPVAISQERAIEVEGEAAQLRGQADALRAKLAAETDRRQRFRYYDELRDIGNALVPLERELRDAGIPARTVPPQPAA